MQSNMKRERKINYFGRTFVKFETFSSPWKNSCVFFSERIFGVWC